MKNPTGYICGQHIKYDGILPPKRTKRNPSGCPACWEIWAMTPGHTNGCKAMIKYREVDLVLKVKGDAFTAAMELHKLGLVVDTVLSRVGTVCGWCSEATFGQVTTAGCVVSYEVNQ